jgi:HD-GYP domain-containing protein (c-di-GMP phosphodiesterase class II)
VHAFTAEEIIRAADTGMYISKHAGGNQVRSAELLGAGENSGMQGQLISGYVEGFLHRENTGPEDLEELVATLRKLCRGREEIDRLALKEGIETVARAAEMREPAADGHGERCAHYAGIIARGLNLTEHEVEDVIFAARVHDVGKLFISERILNKPGPLTESEYAVIKAHPELGAEVLRALPDSKLLEQAVEAHHEAFDGSGYPAGLQGENIPLWARILTVADAYVNMTSDRSFAPAKSNEQAIKELENLSGTRFDGMIVRLFARQLKLEKASSFGS